MNKLTCQIGLLAASCILALALPLYTLFWIYPHFTEIITFEKEVNAKQIANHIAKMIVLDDSTTTLTQDNITSRFLEILREAQVDFDLTKIKIFSSRGEVLYSTDAMDIGTFNTKDYFTGIVAKGNIFSKVVHKDEQTMEKETVRKDVVETYVPLLRNHLFIGAFEIYYDITYSEHNIRRFLDISKVIIILGSVLLLTGVILISASSFLVLKKLRKAEQKFKNLKEQIPSLYNLSLDED